MICEGGVTVTEELSILARVPFRTRLNKHNAAHSLLSFLNNSFSSITLPLDVFTNIESNTHPVQFSPVNRNENSFGLTVCAE
jgi:hypothetical protein